VNRTLTTLATTAAVAAVVAVAAHGAAGTTVSVQIESSEAPAPLFAGTVDSLPHAVDGGDGSGAHNCSGPPGATPAATATGALDDALRGAGISWRGNWNASFRDFFIDRIGPFASRAPDRYWSLSVNGHFSAGGCLTQVEAGDSIRFFYGPLFGADPAAPTDPTGDPAADPSGSDGSRGKRLVTPRRKLRQVARRAAEFLRAHHGVGEDWAGLVLALRAGGSPAEAARRLLGAKLGSQRPDGSLNGDVNATALAVLALRDSNPRAASRATAWLAAAQSQSGGFGYRQGIAADLDSTGLASWALALEGRREAAALAARFIRSAHSPDGGFPALPGGDSNAQSTGLALIGLRVAGLGPCVPTTGAASCSLDYLAGLSRTNGSIAYQRGSSPTPVWTTAQALLGLTARARLLDLDASERAG
jgi:hypothetical protein